MDTKLILQAIVETIEEADPGGSVAFLELLSDDLVVQIAESMAHYDEATLRSTVRRMIAQVDAMTPAKDLRVTRH